MWLHEIPAERRAEIGGRIRDGADALVEEWERYSHSENPLAAGEPRDALRNQLPTLLRDYGQALIDGVAGSLWDRAAEHGAQRYQIGWSPEALARDFMLLRRLLLADLRRSVNLSIDEMIAIASTLDEAVAVSIAVFMQQQERQRGEFVGALKHSNAELKRFAHVVAHEIRNPLSSVLAAVHRMERDAGEQVRKPLSIVREAVATIKSVTDDLLRYADAEAMQPKPQDVDLNEAAGAAIESLASLIEQRGADVAIEVALPTIRGYRSPLVQLFTNLIENAVKYAAEAPPRVRIRVAPDREGAIVVEDNGLGVPPDKCEEIFRFFRRVHPGRARGSGIGLAVCKRVAEQHGGRIWVESDWAAGCSSGSRFYVVLRSVAPETPIAEVRGRRASSAAAPAGG